MGGTEREADADDARQGGEHGEGEDEGGPGVAADPEALEVLLEGVEARVIIDHGIGHGAILDVRRSSWCRPTVAGLHDVGPDHRDRPQIRPNGPTPNWPPLVPSTVNRCSRIRRYRDARRRLSRTGQQGVGGGAQAVVDRRHRRDRPRRRRDDLRDRPAHPQGRRPGGDAGPDPRPRGRRHDRVGRLAGSRPASRATGCWCRASPPAARAATAGRAATASASAAVAGSSATRSTAPRPSTSGCRSPTPRPTCSPTGSATSSC